MLKKLLDGLIFGTGLAVAFVIVSAIGLHFALPRILSSATMETSQPTFDNPKEAVIAVPQPQITLEEKPYSFFKDHDARMKIPEGGGILAMSPTITPKGSNRPSTYQLWLTANQLWQIRTTEDKAEIEELARAKDMQAEALDKLMREKLGMPAGQSAMTVSADEINRIKSLGNSSRDDSLNGQLKMSVEGVVFVLPEPYAK